MDSSGVRQVQEGSGEKRKIEETDCEVICGAPTTVAVCDGEGEEHTEILTLKIDVRQFSIMICHRSQQ